MPCTIKHLEPHQQGVVRGLQTPEGRPDWGQQLADLGFVAGERVTLLRRGLWGEAPLVVRVGHSTYALRAAEADCVLIDRLP